MKCKDCNAYEFLISENTSTCTLGVEGEEFKNGEIGCRHKRTSVDRALELQAWAHLAEDTKGGVDNE